MVYVFHGSNSHYKEILLNKLKAKYKDYNINHLDFSEDDNLKSLDTLLSQNSLFDSNSKIIYIKNFTKVTDIDFLYKVLQKYLDNDSIILILDTPEKLRSNSRLFKIVKKNQDIIECKEYTNLELEKLIKDKIKNSNIKDIKKFVNDFLLRVDNDPYNIENEISKIALLSNTDNWEQYISKSTNYSIWEYINNIGKGKNLKAVAIIEDMLSKGESEYSILGMVYWYLRLILLIKTFPEKSDLDIARTFGYAPYSISNTRNSVKNYSKDKILGLYEKSLDLDAMIKSGNIEPRLGIILLSLVL